MKRYLIVLVMFAVCRPALAQTKDDSARATPYPIIDRRAKEASTESDTALTEEEQHIVKLSGDPFVEERFKEADTDDDGALTEQERNIAKFAVSEHFDTMGEDQNGQVTLYELGEVLFAKAREWAGDMKDADTDGDGTLSKEEAEEGAPSLVKLFENADTNHDSRLSEDEYQAHMRRRFASGSDATIYPNIVDFRF